MSNDVDSTVPFERPTGRSLVCLSVCPSTPTPLLPPWPLAGNGANASVLFYFCIFFGVFQLLRRCLYIFQVVCV